MGNLYVIVGIVLILGVVLGLLSSKFGEDISDKKRQYKYQKKDYLLSRAEHQFFDVLVDALGDHYYVFPQIHLITLLDHKINGQNWRGAFRHIDEKSVDFVICDKSYIKPLVAIELDDKSHGTENRIERDEEVKRILQDAGVPLLRFENHGSFDKEEIKNRIINALGK